MKKLLISKRRPGSAEFLISTGLAFVFIFAVIVILGSCGQKKVEGLELSYYGWNEGDYLQKVVDAYNAQDGKARITLTTFPSSDYDDKLLTMLAGGTDIDLFNMRSPQLLSRLASSGNLKDLTALIQDRNFDTAVYGEGYEDTVIDGKFYALPYRNQAYALFYNKKIFDSRTIPYPENITWDEYADLALSLSEGRGSSRNYGGFIPDWLYAPFITQQMGSSIADTNTEPTRAWLEYLNRLYNIDNSHMSFAEMKSSGTDYMIFFLSGRTAMLPNGDWVVSDLLTALREDPGYADTFELGISFLPQVVDTPKRTIGGVSTFIGINAKSSNTDAAFDFAIFLAGPQGAKILAESGALPSYNNPEIIQSYQETMGVQGGENLLTSDTVPEGLIFPEFDEIKNIYSEEKELYLIGEQTIDQTIENFVDRRRELLK